MGLRGERRGADVHVRVAEKPPCQVQRNGPHVQGHRDAERGQATVELVMALPVFIVVAAIAVNALLFFSECASFDRVSANLVRVHAASPASGQGPARTETLIEQGLNERFDAGYLACSVATSDAGFGLTVYRSTLTFSPTLFGLGLKQEVLGIALPRICHTSVVVIDPYRSGVVA